MPISNRGQDKRSDIAVHTHTHTHTRNIHTFLLVFCLWFRSSTFAKVFPFRGYRPLIWCIHRQSLVACGATITFNRDFLVCGSAGSKGPSMKLVCYCSSVSGIRTLLVNCCTQINRYTQVLEINMICIVHLQSCTFKPQMVYTTPLVGGLIACILAVRVEPQISTVIHYYFYSTVVQNLFKTKGTATH